ncbi:MAG: hypothetical protein ABIO70_24445, partial [Pseudomonadota bacterium]
MALKITCPSCGRVHPLGEPLPLPGSSRRCPCGQIMAINFPPQVLEQLRRRGARFEPRVESEAKPVTPAPTLDLLVGPPPSRAGPQPPGTAAADDPFAEPPTIATRREPVVRPGPGMEGFEEWEPTAVDTRLPAERTVPPPEPGPPPSLPPPAPPVRRSVVPAAPPRAEPPAAPVPPARPAPVAPAV